MPIIADQAPMVLQTPDLTEGDTPPAPVEETELIPEPPLEATPTPEEAPPEIEIPVVPPIQQTLKSDPLGPRDIFINGVMDAATDAQKARFASSPALLEGFLVSKKADELLLGNPGLSLSDAEAQATDYLRNTGATSPAPRERGAAAALSFDAGVGPNWAKAVQWGTVYEPGDILRGIAKVPSNTAIGVAETSMLMATPVLAAADKLSNLLGYDLVSDETIDAALYGLTPEERESLNTLGGLLDTTHTPLGHITTEVGTFAAGSALLALAKPVLAASPWIAKAMSGGKRITEAGLKVLPQQTVGVATAVLRFLKEAAPMNLVAAAFGTPGTTASAIAMTAGQKELGQRMQLWFDEQPVVVKRSLMFAEGFPFDMAFKLLGKIGRALQIPDVAVAGGARVSSPMTPNDYKRLNDFFEIQPDKTLPLDRALVKEVPVAPEVAPALATRTKAAKRVEAKAVRAARKAAKKPAKNKGKQPKPVDPPDILEATPETKVSEIAPAKDLVVEPVVEVVAKEAPAEAAPVISSSRAVARRKNVPKRHNDIPFGVKYNRGFIRTHNDLDGDIVEYFQKLHITQVGRAPFEVDPKLVQEMATEHGVTSEKVMSRWAELEPSVLELRKVDTSLARIQSFVDTADGTVKKIPTNSGPNGSLKFARGAYDPLLWAKVPVEITKRFIDLNASPIIVGASQLILQQDVTGDGEFGVSDFVASIGAVVGLRAIRQGYLKASRLLTKAEQQVITKGTLNQTADLVALTKGIGTTAVEAMGYEGYAKMWNTLAEDLLSNTSSSLTSILQKAAGIYDTTMKELDMDTLEELFRGDTWVKGASRGNYELLPKVITQDPTTLNTAIFTLRDNLIAATKQFDMGAPDATAVLDRYNKMLKHYGTTREAVAQLFPSNMSTGDMQATLMALDSAESRFLQEITEAITDTTLSPRVRNARITGGLGQLHAFTKWLKNPNDPNLMDIFGRLDNHRILEHLPDTVTFGRALEKYDQAADSLYTVMKEQVDTTGDIFGGSEALLGLFIEKAGKLSVSKSMTDATLGYMYQSVLSHPRIFFGSTLGNVLHLGQLLTSRTIDAVGAGLADDITEVLGYRAGMSRLYSEIPAAFELARKTAVTGVKQIDPDFSQVYQAQARLETMGHTLAIRDSSTLESVINYVGDIFGVTPGSLNIAADVFTSHLERAYILEKELTSRAAKQIEDVLQGPLLGAKNLTELGGIDIVLRQKTALRDDPKVLQESLGITYKGGQQASFLSNYVSKRIRDGNIIEENNVLSNLVVGMKDKVVENSLGKHIWPFLNTAVNAGDAGIRSSPFGFAYDVALGSEGLLYNKLKGGLSGVKLDPSKQRELDRAFREMASKVVGGTIVGGILLAGLEAAGQRLVSNLPGFDEDLKNQGFYPGSVVDTETGTTTSTTFVDTTRPAMFALSVLFGSSTPVAPKDEESQSALVMWAGATIDAFMSNASPDNVNRFWDSLSKNTGDNRRGIELSMELLNKVLAEGASRMTPSVMRSVQATHDNILQQAPQTPGQVVGLEERPPVLSPTGETKEVNANAVASMFGSQSAGFNDERSKVLGAAGINLKHHAYRNFKYNGRVVNDPKLLEELKRISGNYLVPDGTWFNIQRKASKLKTPEDKLRFYRSVLKGFDNRALRKMGRKLQRFFDSQGDNQ